MSFTVGFDISGLDTEFKAHAQRGIGRYVRELKRYFEACGGDESVAVEFFDHKSMRLQGPAALRLAAEAVERMPIGRTTLRQQLVYPLQLSSAAVSQGSKRRFDAFHFPAHMDPPAWGRTRYLVTVLDLIPLVCADLYKANKSGFRFHFARWLELQAIRNAALILCISENTARDVHRLLGVDEDRLVVTPLGVDPKFFSAAVAVDPVEIRRRYGLPQEAPLLLYVGGIDPRKNYTLMLRAFSELVKARADAGAQAPGLLMAGNTAGDREYPRLCALINELGLKDRVFMPGYVEDRDLLQLYTICSAFFFPSLYEGFGLPPLEAMAAGLPVVSSNSSAMPEVLGDAALMFDPSDCRAAVEALSAVLSNQELARSLSARGRERARLFTWDRTGEKTLGAYRRLAGQVL